MKELYIIRAFVNGDEQREYTKVVRKESDAISYMVYLNHLLYDEHNVLKLTLVRA